MSLPEHRWLFRAQYRRTKDGDTFVVRLDRGFGQYDEEPSALSVIRLKDAWAPELHAPGGPEARLFTSLWLEQSMTTGTWPLLLETDMLPEPKRGEMTDDWSRFVARVWRVADGACLNDDLIAAGHAAATR